MSVERGTSFDLRRCVPMSRYDDHRCAVEYVKTKDPRLAERLIVANMRLVMTMASSSVPTPLGGSGRTC
jgi:hypothetical protein